MAVGSGSDELAAAGVLAFADDMNCRTALMSSDVCGMVIPWGLGSHAVAGRGYRLLPEPAWGDEAPSDVVGSDRSYGITSS